MTDTIPGPRELSEADLTMLDGGSLTDSPLVWLWGLIICPINPFPRDYQLRY